MMKAAETAGKDAHKFNTSDVYAVKPRNKETRARKEGWDDLQKVPLHP